MSLRWKIMLLLMGTFVLDLPLQAAGVTP